MFAAVAQLMPAVAKFCRQIVPPVIATLIAALLISAYNTTFSSHLSQPRLSGLHAEESASAPVTTIGITKPPAAPVTETITIYEEAVAPERLTDKDAKEEAGKDQGAIKTAAEPAPAPVRTAQAQRPEPKPEARHEPRAEPRRLAALELAQPVAPAPAVIAVPPAVVIPPTTAPVVAAIPPVQEQQQQQQQLGTLPIVTVPDRLSARPAAEAQVPPAPPRGAMGTFVHALKPSTWFAQARAFGDKIEQVGNDILPSIRQ